MKKSIFLTLLFAAIFSIAHADGGMWLPLFLNYNEAEMQSLGFKLTAEDVYSVNHNSMKDAVMLFGGGCTGELISSQGLVLTNHHCGYSYVQSHSTMEQNHLQNGFWAKSKSEEIPMEGLTVTFLVYMEDVTASVLKDVTDEMDEAQRKIIIDNNIKDVIKKATEGTTYKASIKPFYYGNQYFMFVTETYSDVRLVGVPPESIGKFGGDSDNWMWPRHTGDFSLWRIYTDKDGKPAKYSPDNIPMRPKKYFPISIKTGGLRWGGSRVGRKAYRNSGRDIIDLGSIDWEAACQQQQTQENHAQSKVVFHSSIQPVLMKVWFSRSTCGKKASGNDKIIQEKTKSDKR